MKCYYCNSPATRIIFKKPICFLCRYNRKKLLAELRYHKKWEAFDKFIIKLLSVDKSPTCGSVIAEKVLKIGKKLGFG